MLRFLRARAPQHAEDLLSEVFAVAVRRADAIPAGAERAWLFGVAKTCCATISARSGGHQR